MTSGRITLIQPTCPITAKIGTPFRARVADVSPCAFLSLARPRTPPAHSAETRAVRVAVQALVASSLRSPLVPIFHLSQSPSEPPVPPGPTHTSRPSLPPFPLPAVSNTLPTHHQPAVYAIYCHRTPSSAKLYHRVHIVALSCSLYTFSCSSAEPALCLALTGPRACISVQGAQFLPRCGGGEQRRGGGRST